MPDAPACARACRALLVDADDALRDLLGEWLAERGCGLAAEPDGGRFDLILVDLPFPRQGGASLVQRLRRAHPGTPILALSSGFFAGIDRCGAVARELGVAGVLPMPVTREALLAAVSGVLARNS